MFQVISLLKLEHQALHFTRYCFRSRSNLINHRRARMFITRRKCEHEHNLISLFVFDFGFEQYIIYSGFSLNKMLFRTSYNLKNSFCGITFLLVFPAVSFGFAERKNQEAHF